MQSKDRVIAEVIIGEMQRITEKAHERTLEVGASTAAAEMLINLMHAGVKAAKAALDRDEFD